MSKPVLLLDCDGVLADFITPTLDYVNWRMGTDHKYEDVKSWDLSPLIAEEIEDKIMKLWQRDGFALNLKALPGARAGVNYVKKFAEIIVVTTPLQGSKTWAYDRETWLIAHMGIEAENVVHTCAKQLVRGDMFVDDKPGNVEAWGEENGYHKAFLWDAPYNREDRHLNRLHNWDELVSEFQKLTGAAL